MKTNKKEFIEGLLRKTKLLFPTEHERLETYFNEALSTGMSEENALSLTELQQRALVDRDAARELCEIRVTAVNNYVTAMSNARAFFTTVELDPADVPYLRNETKQEVKAMFIGADGKPHFTQAIKEQTDVPIPLRIISTEDYEYMLVDIYKGNVADMARANADLAYDLAMKIDKELWALVFAAVSPFVTSGRKVSRTMNLHSSINAANMPTTNLIQTPGNGASTKLRFASLKAVVKHCLAFGTNATSLGEIAPVTMYAPSSQVGDFLDEIEVNSPDNAFVQEIKDVGHVVTIGGKRINIVPDATLDPALNRATVRLNRPLGEVFEKPSMDMIYPTSPDQITDAQRKANKASTSMSKVYAAVIPEPNRIGVCQVQYQND